MKTKLKIVVVVLMMLSMLFITTSADGQIEHKHEYNPNWTYNEINHWHDAICQVENDCVDAICDFAEHTIVDGACSVCGYATDVDDGSGDNTGNDDSSNTPGGEDSGDGPDNPGEDPDGTGKDPVCEHQYTCEQTKAPDCIDIGENTFTCSLCGDSYTELIDPIGHNEMDIPGTAPTCTSSGLSKGKQCLTCGEITKKQQFIAPMGHRYNLGVCIVCSYVDPEYVEPDDDHIRVTTTDNNCWVDKVYFTATESGDYTFTLPVGLGAWDAKDKDSGKSGPIVDSLHPSYIAKEYSFTVAIPAESTYEFYIGAASRKDWLIHWSFVAREIEEDDEDQTAQKELLIGDNAINGENIDFTYSAASDGNLTLSIGVAISGNVQIWYSVNGGESVAIDIESTLTLTLLKGDAVVINVIAEGYSSISAAWDGESNSADEEPPEDIDISGEYIGTDAFGNSLLTVIIDSTESTVLFKYFHPLTGPNNVRATYTIKKGVITLYDQSGIPLHPLSGTLTLVNGVPATASFDGITYTLTLGEPDIDDGGGVVDGEIVINGVMIDNVENIFTVSASELANDRMYVTFIPLKDGLYDFFGQHIFVKSMTTEDGVRVEQDDYDYFILKADVNYIVEITLEYIAHTGDYTITPVYQIPKGHPDNPFWYTLGENVTAMYNGDHQPIWYQFYADVTGTLNVNSTMPGVNVMISALPYFDIAAVETTSIDVVKGRKYYIGIAAYDSTEPIGISFKASISEGEITTDGSINMPHIIELGSNHQNIGAHEGVYLLYKATSNGKLTLSPNSAGFIWCFTDFIEPVQTTMGEISVHLYMGDIVYLYIEANVDTSSPVSFTASFTNDAKETWVDGPFILDGSAANEIELDENCYALFKLTGETGQFMISWTDSNVRVAVNDRLIESGTVINITNAWFGPFFKTYFEGYDAGIIKLTITEV